MNEMQYDEDKIEYIHDKTQDSPKPCHRDGKHQVPLQRRKMIRIKGFGEDISQLPLCVIVFYLYISHPYMVSQEAVSHFYVFRSPLKNWVLG
jgi:hypothetical protein